MRIHVARHATPIGPVDCACDGGAVVALEFADADDRLRRHLRRRYGAIASETTGDPLRAGRRIASYFDGDLAAFDDLPVDPAGTRFQQRVWSALRDIAPGRTLGYGELARRLGRPSASRAVGAANGANPIAIAVPCHRLVGADGRLTGYAGGLARKRWLLAHEGALPDDARDGSAEEEDGPRSAMR